MTKLPIPKPYPLGARVTWREGSRECMGVIDVVHQQGGWPAEYGVCPLKADGTPRARLRRLHHSQLNPLPPRQPDTLPPDEVRSRLTEI